MMFFADCSDTSCSADRPPKTIPTRIFLAMMLSLYHFEALVGNRKLQISARGRWLSPPQTVAILNKVRLRIVPLCANQFELSIRRMAV
jgi:hypothetical protein